MHVLIIPSWYPLSPDDANGSFFREQALALTRHGHQVGVISPQLSSLRYPGTWRSTFQNTGHEDDRGVATYRSYGLNWLPILPHISVEPWVRKGLKLFRHYVREHGKPDVLHAHAMFNGGLLASRISEQFGVPFVITEHSSVYGRGLAKKWQLNLGEKAAMGASATLAVSEKLATLLDEKFHLHEGTWKYLPNMIGEPFTRYRLAESESGRNGSFRFCTISYLNANKAVDLLLRAFALAFSKSVETQIVIGGDGKERARLQALVKELELDRQVQFLGSLSRDEVLETISQSDALALASRYETFGVVLLEALALGKPVLATRCGGPESIVQAGDGFLVENGSVEALTRGLIELRERAVEFDPAKLRESCLRRFGEAVVVEKLTAIYRSVLDEWKAANG
jgi:glycosyltransferase involved in cell wall biosynthesis